MPKPCAGRVQALAKLKFLPRPWFKAAGTIEDTARTTIGALFPASGPLLPPVLGYRGYIQGWFIWGVCPDLTPPTSTLHERCPLSCGRAVALLLDISDFMYTSALFLSHALFHRSGFIFFEGREHPEVLNLAPIVPRRLQ